MHWYDECCQPIMGDNYCSLLRTGEAAYTGVLCPVLALQYKKDLNILKHIQQQARKMIEGLSMQYPVFSWTVQHVALYS